MTDSRETRCGAWALFAIVGLFSLSLVSCLGEIPPVEAEEPTGDDAPSTESPEVTSDEVAPPPEPTPIEDPPAITTPEDEATSIRGVETVVLSPRSAVIYWETAWPADSEVLYGKSSDLEEAPIVYGAQERFHEVLLDGLEAGTLYHYRVSSRWDDRSTSSEVLSFTTSRPWKLQVRDAHPRIYITDETLPLFRERIKGPLSEHWRRLRSYYDSALSDSPKELLSHMEFSSDNLGSLALVALLEGNSSYRSKAEATAIFAASLDPRSFNRRYRQSYLEGMAYVYDWLYDDLSSTSRSKIRAGIEKYMSGWGLTDTDYIEGHGFENFQQIMIGGLAIYTESSKGKAIVDDNLYRYQSGFFPSWRHFARDGGSILDFWYTGFRLKQAFRTAHAFSTATNLDFFESEATWMRGLTDWFAWGLRTDDSFPRTGDFTTFSGLDAHYSVLSDLIVTHYGDQTAQWLSRGYDDILGVWGPRILPTIVFSDPDVAAKAPGGALSRLFRGTGTVCMRDRWSGEPVLVRFRTVPYFVMGHQHLDSNSFTIYYRGGQALDSGKYDDFGGDHHMNYYQRTIAHNSMLIHDPDQKFTRYSKTYANDGGQHWRRPGTDSSGSRPYHIHECLDPQNGYKVGSLVTYEDAPAYTYACGDAGPAYAKDKVKAFDRHVLFLRSVEGFEKPVLVVFDWVRATSSSFKKTYLLHTQNSPSVSGTRVQATNRGGMVFQQTVLPALADIRVLGGSGREFYVAGTNYAPVKSPSKYDEVGNYRVEVSPSAKSAEDHFLHVLHATDAGSSTPPAASSVSATGMKGVRVGNWIAMFRPTAAPVDAVSYKVDGMEPLSHVLLGVAPESGFEIVLDGSIAGTLRSSFEGTVHFETDTTRTIEVRRVEK